MIHPKDEGKFVNAVLKYQVKSILQEGVIDLHMTLGELELKSFEHTQNNLKQAQLPYFVRVRTFQLLSYYQLLLLILLAGTRFVRPSAADDVSVGADGYRH